MEVRRSLVHLILALALPATFLGIATPAGAAAPTVVSVDAGEFHTCALTSAGGVFCWGDDYAGDLGDGAAMGALEPVGVSGLSQGVTAIAVGGSHSCALMTSGHVKCWGLNVSGEVGDGTFVDRDTPRTVSGLSHVQAIAAGSYHTCALSAAGAVECWGNNLEGQLGDGTKQNRATPVPVLGLSSGVVAIAAGTFHTCAVLDTGGVECWGSNYDGELGSHSHHDRAKPVKVFGLSSAVLEISSGGYHTCVLLASGAAECWGLGAYGQIGDGKRRSRSRPVAVTGLPAGVEQIEPAEGNHTCAVVAGGRVLCWGQNDHGDLGDGTTKIRPTPTQVSGIAGGATAVAGGGIHTCAIVGGSVECWGDNDNAQLGDGTLHTRHVPTPVSWP